MSFTTVPLTTSYDLSSQGSLSIGTEELKGFKSGTLSIEGETVENSARGDGGWTVAAPGKRSATLETTFLKLPTDACQAGIRSLSLDPNYQSLGVPVVYRSNASSPSDGSGFKGTFVLTSYSETQTDGGDAVECSANFAGYGAIEVDNASGSGSGSGAGT